MEIEHEPSIRGRLNQLVQMFEKKSKQEEMCHPAPIRFRKTPSARFQQAIRQQSVQEPCERRMDPSNFSVKSIIKTFNVVPESGQPHRRSSSNADIRRKALLAHGSLLPEVKTLVNEIFDRIVDSHKRSLSMSSRCSSDRDLSDESFIVDTTDTESCISVTEAVAFLPISGKIGALWTSESLSELQKTDSDVKQLCTKKLSQYVESLGLSLTNSEKKTTPEQRAADLKATIQRVMSQVEEDDVTSAVTERKEEFSVRTFRALIEMTVLVGESPKPTINAINRTPSGIKTDDDSSVIFSTDDLLTA